MGDSPYLVEVRDYEHEHEHYELGYLHCINQKGIFSFQDASTWSLV